MADRYPHVVFYGCGSMFHSVLGTWRSYIGRPISWCCDSDSSKWGRSFGGVRCISVDELVAIKDECAVFVTIDRSQGVFDLLSSRGFPAIHTLYMFDLIASEYLLTTDRSELVDNLRDTYEMLSDQRSRDVFSAIMERVFGDGTRADIMARVRDCDQYFAPDIVNLTRDESFVDVGAFTGDTVLDFVTRTSGQFERVYAFEMDSANFSALSATVAALPQRERIHPFNIGLWDEDAEILYSPDDSSSRIGAGTAVGRVRPLDDVLNGDRVTFVKMDVEGAEPQALRGAAATIAACRPTMAVCVYHDLRHLWEIPQYLKGLVPDYRIFLRQYTDIERETVCYALL
jgi:FkbM family methyltransferase